MLECMTVRIFQTVCMSLYARVYLALLSQLMNELVYRCESVGVRTLDLYVIEETYTSIHTNKHVRRKAGGETFDKSN